MEPLTLQPKTDLVTAVLLTDDTIYEVAEWLGADRIVISETLKTQNERIPRKAVEFFFAEDEDGSKPWPGQLRVIIGHYIVRAEPNRFEDNVTFRSETPANLHQHYRNLTLPKDPDGE